MSDHVFHLSTRADALHQLFISLSFPLWTVSCMFVFVLFQVARKFSGITKFNMPFHQWHFFTSTSRQHWKVSVFFFLPLLCNFQLQSCTSCTLVLLRVALSLQYIFSYDISRVWFRWTDFIYYYPPWLWCLFSLCCFCRALIHWYTLYQYLKSFE